MALGCSQCGLIWRDLVCPINLTVNVPANITGGAQYQIQHSAANGDVNDIGVVLLVDQVNSAPDRLLVAPYTAQQYTLFTDPAVDGVAAAVAKKFTMVGYGLTGTGLTGQSQANETKLAGQNRFDVAGFKYDRTLTMTLMYDFDRAEGNGFEAIDPNDILYGLPNPGLGAAESMHAKGDSGGPAFVGNNVIAGVLSSHISPGMPPDINNKTDATFGELGFTTNVSMTLGDTALQNVLNPGGGTKYDLVLDMNQQIYGSSIQNDTVSIVARNVNGRLHIEVFGTAESADPSLSGLYYDAPIANIRSLTIRGSNDDSETIDIEGLTVDSINIDGRGRDDTIRVGFDTLLRKMVIWRR